MSTRCQLGFYDAEEEDLEEWQALIYRHLDGHPNAVLGDIIPILKSIREIVGFYDVEYVSAFVVSELKTGFKNIGISKDFHGDLDFYYAIFPDKIKVYQCRYHQPFTDWKLIKTVVLGSKKNEG